MKGYLAYDDAITGKRPAVLVVHECWGHLDYIHINPVKHGLVTRVRDWPYSTFHRLVVEGIYAENWAMSWHSMMEFEPPLIDCVVSNRNYSIELLLSC